MTAPGRAALLCSVAVAACAGPAPRQGPAPVPAPAIVSAAQWGSQPLPVPDRRRHVPARITVHHAGVLWNEGDDPYHKLQALQSWGQRERGWADVPYHWLIAPDGRIFAGRDPAYEGDTNTEYDVTGHLLVQLWGDFERQRVRHAQLESAVDLIAHLCGEYGLDPATIAGHRDWSRQTACPGADLVRYLDGGHLRRWVEAVLAGRDPDVRVLPPRPPGP